MARTALANFVRSGGQSSPAAEFAAIDAMTAELYAPQILYSSDPAWALVGDDSTDNGASVNAWIAAANAILNASSNNTVKMVMVPSASGAIYRSTLRHNFPGGADVEFVDSFLKATGTDDTAPLFTHGDTTACRSGRLTGINLLNGFTHNYYNKSYVALRLLNKTNAHHDVGVIAGFTIGVQFRAMTLVSTAVGFCSYNTLKVGSITDCTVEVDFNGGTADTSFCSENKCVVAHIQGSSGFNNFGSNYGLQFSRDYENSGYSGHSGNFLTTSCEMGLANLSWAATATLTAGRRYFTPKIGGEWLCKTGGTSGTVEPSIIPNVDDGTLVLNATTGLLTITQGSAIATMTATAALSAGMHMRGTNPTDAFPLDTYIVSVDSGTQITLSHNANRIGVSNGTQISANYKGIFVTPTTDNGATLVYLGPLRKAPVYHHDAGVNNGFLGRWESGVGEAVLISGTHLFPQATTSYVTCIFEGKFYARTQVAVNNCNFPKWHTARAYVKGDGVRPAVLGTTYIECIAAGTSHASTEPTLTGTVGTTIVDNGATWIERLIPTTDALGDVGFYYGGPINNAITITTPGQKYFNSQTIPNLQERAIISATGAIVKGIARNSGGVTSGTFPAADIVLSRSGVIYKGADLIGVLVKTSGKLRCFSISPELGAYTSANTYLIPLDASFNAMGAASGQNSYHPRIISGATTLSGGFYSTNNGIPGVLNIFVQPEVAYVFVGYLKGAGNFTLGGLSVSEVPHRTQGNAGVTGNVSNPVMLASLFGHDNGIRASMGTPLSGYFKSVGEPITNASVVTGGTVPGEYKPTVGGILAPAWAGSVAVIKGELKTNSGNVYAANGAFTTGTAPTTTVSNILDGTATSIASGDVATWDYMGPAATVSAGALFP